MAIQDTDICLNVTVGPVVAAKKKKKGIKTECLKTVVKRLKNESLQKSTLASDKKSNSNVRVGASNRVKQKSLAVIFAKKLKETNTITPSVRKYSQLPLRNKNIPVKSEKLKQTDTLSKSDTKSDCTSSTVNNNIINESIVSFTKSTNGYVGKTLLAKRRNTAENKEKKSLSDVFSNHSKNENKLNLSNVLDKRNTEENTKITIQSKVIPEETSESSKVDVIKDKNKKNFNKKREQKIIHKDNKEKNLNKINKELDKSVKPIHRPAGKKFTLFGNNPDIPNIGQRLVKPVNEPIFTEITFTGLNIHPFMISNLEQNMHITKMTMVQQKAIPQIFSTKDVLIRSQTGSGKTLAYALPIVELLHKVRPKLSRTSGLSALVIVPTRELALQTYECFIKLVKPFTWIVPGYLTGGEKRKAEKARLRKGCNILIATPGRLLDHIKHTEALKLNRIQYFVLDEADRMLDMGYEKDISEIASALKVSSSNDESGYDAMKIFKQNVKKVFTDEEIESQEEILKKDDIESRNETIENNADCNTKQEYHSSDESDGDGQTGDYIVPSKKKSKSTKDCDTNKRSNKKLEIDQNTEEHGGNINSNRRQTILLSATLTQAVQKLAGLAMQNPIFIDAAKENLEIIGGDISEINEDLIVPQSVLQSYVVTPPKLRMVTLSAYIAGKCQIPGEHKILIFMATQDMVDYHTEILSSVLTKPTDEDDEDSDPLVHVEFFKLHGNMTQKERTEVFKTFRQVESGVLLCTDVAARGLDMPKVDCVVQYTGPISARDYVHRIGRTARAGCSGTATIFLTPPEVEFVRMLESRRIRIKQEDMNDILDKLLGPLSKHNSVQAAAIALQNDFENVVSESRQLGARACKAYVSWVRFYSSYPRDMREIFNRKELHLGHYAKSFALKDPPQRIGGMGKKLREEENSRPQHNNRLSNKQSDGVPQKERRKGQDGSGQRTGLLKRVKMLNTSEYDSGLEPVKKPRK